MIERSRFVTIRRTFDPFEAQPTRPACASSDLGFFVPLRRLATLSIVGLPPSRP